MTRTNDARRAAEFADPQHDGRETVSENKLGGHNKYSEEPPKNSERDVSEFVCWLAVSKPAWHALTAYAKGVAARGGRVTRDMLCAFLSEGEGGHDVTNDAGEYSRLDHNLGTVALRWLVHENPELAPHVRVNGSPVDDVLAELWG